MSVVDLLFLLAVVIAVAALSTAGICALLGRRARAFSLLRATGLGAAAYLVVSIAAAWLRPQRVIPVGAPWCFDDWCLTVEQVQHTATPSAMIYRVDLRIFSRARRVHQSARGAWIHLIDDRGRIYDPDPDPSAVPLDITLAPLESVTASRCFRVPRGEGRLGLVTGHGSSYCGAMSFLIIGDGGCLFHKPTIIRIE